jgi:hypothetical protein
VQNPPPVTPSSGEKVTAIIPFVDHDTGLTSSEPGSFIITDRRIIFARTPPALREEKALEGKRIWAELEKAINNGLDDSAASKRTYLRERNWIPGSWERYSTMNPDAVAAESPGNLSLAYEEISVANFVIARKEGLSDTVDLKTKGTRYEFRIGFALGPATISLLRAHIGDRAKDLMATWGTIDNVVTLLGGKRC